MRKVAFRNGRLSSLYLRQRITCGHDAENETTKELSTDAVGEPGHLPTSIPDDLAEVHRPRRDCAQMHGLR